MQGGSFIQDMAQWVGAHWSALGNGPDGGSVYKMLVTGGYVYAAGGFSVTQNSIHYVSLARYILSTHAWSDVGGSHLIAAQSIPVRIISSSFLT